VDWHVVELPQLKRLLIEWWECGDRLVACLACAPLLDQLESLVLVRTELTAHGIRTMLDHAERFAKIRQLVLLGVATELDDIAPLRERFPNIIVQTRSTWHCGDDNWRRSPSTWRRELTRF
jgi:hypothetical protein